MANTKDIFEELRRKCGSMYISDLRTKYFRGAAMHFLEKESFEYSDVAEPPNMMK